MTPLEINKIKTLITALLSKKASSAHELLMRITSKIQTCHDTSELFISYINTGEKQYLSKCAVLSAPELSNVDRVDEIDRCWFYVNFPEITSVKSLFISDSQNV